MDNSEIVRNLPTDVKTLQVKQKFNEAKLICQTMDDPDRGKRCMKSVQDAESQFEDNMRTHEQEKKLDQLTSLGENPYPVENREQTEERLRNQAEKARLE